MSSVYTQMQVLDRKLVASISSALASAGVPNVLWGNYLLTVYGVPSIVDGVAFAVPDESIETASSVIQKIGFSPCAQGLDCPVLNGYLRHSPKEHFHIDEELTISIYPKSNVLWELSFSKGSSDLFDASDKRLPVAVPGRGQGRFPSEFDFVQIPHPARYCEAVIMLLCRDHDTRFANYWMAILTYILEYMDESGLFNERDLGEAYKPFYHALKEGEFSRMYRILDELRQDLTPGHHLSVKQD